LCRVSHLEEDFGLFWSPYQPFDRGQQKVINIAAKMALRIALFLVISLANSLPGITSTKDHTADIIISNVRVVSPPDLILNKATVVIHGSRISYVGTEKVSALAKANIDGSGKTLIPGLIDSHIHLLIGPESKEDYELALENILPTKLDGYLSRGVTTVMSVGDYWPQILDVRDRLEKGEWKGPRLLISGPMITATNGHPRDLPECIKNPYCSMPAHVDTEQQGRALVRELAAAGVDAIKASYDGRDAAGGMTLAKYSPRVLRAIIEESHAHKLHVCVFATLLKDAVDAVSFGADCLSHRPSVGTTHHSKGAIEVVSSYYDFTQLVKQKEVTVGTTTGMFLPVVDPWGVKREAHTAKKYGEVTDYGNGFVVNADDINRAAFADTRFLHSQGVLLAFGTDTFRLAPTIGVPLEWRALRNSHLTPLDILTTATRNAALAIGRENDLGAIKHGYLADLVLIDGNPLLDIEALSNISMVIVDGKKVTE
jgi:imidazolonepropionase-like amidohydrolase